MIRINLLKGLAPRQRARKPLPVKLIAGVAAGLCVAVALVGSGMWVVKAVRSRPAPKHEVVKAVAVTPSSLVNSRVVEDVVKDIAVERERSGQDGYLDLPYEQFSLSEKINFEGLFAREACGLLIRAVPEDVGLRSLEITDYRTIYAVGLSSSRDQVNRLFSSLKEERVTLLQPPLSLIKPNQSGGYRFAFTCTASWGLNVADPCVDLSLSTLPLKDMLSRTIDKFVAVAKTSNLTFAGAPRQVNAAKVGTYRRFEYKFSGTSTFANFAAFLKALCDAHVTCAVKTLSMNARSKGQVGFDAVVVFTTKD